MDARPPVTLEAEVACGEIHVRADARSPFRRVRVTLDRYPLALDREGRYLGTLPRAVEGQRALVIVASAGRHEERVELVPPAPYTVSAAFEGAGVAGAVHALRFTPDPGCMRPELQLPYVVTPARVTGTVNGAPFDVAVTPVAGGAVDVATWADGVAVDYALAWEGWTFPAGTASFPLAPRRIDGDDDGVTAAEGDCDDHDREIRPGIADAPRDRVDADCDGEGGPAFAPAAPQDATIAAGDRPSRAPYLGEAAARHVVAVPRDGEAWVALRSRRFQGPADVAVRVTATAPVDVELWRGGWWSEPATTVTPAPWRDAAPPAGDAPPGLGRLADAEPLVVARVGPDTAFALPFPPEPPRRRRGTNITAPLVGGLWKRMIESEPGSDARAGWTAATGLALAAAPFTLAIDALSWLGSERPADPPPAVDALLYLRLVPADASVPARSAEIRLGG